MMTLHINDGFQILFQDDDITLMTDFKYYVMMMTFPSY